MASSEDGNALAYLKIGLNTTSVFVKVERIIRLTGVRYPLGPDRPMKSSPELWPWCSLV